MEKEFKKWYNKYVGQKETAGAVSFLGPLSPVGINASVSQCP